MAAWEGDLLERKEVAGFLKNLLESDENIKVINIDSPWGTGKTFFLDNWSKNLINERGVVYFNAWEKDYTGDPFVSLVSAIRDQLKNQRDTSGKVDSKMREFTGKASKAILSTTPAIAKILSKGVLKKYLAVDSEEISEVLQTTADEMTEKAVEALILSSVKDQEAVEEFRTIFEELVQEVSKAKPEGNEGHPVYIFIDELDRCRPTYAIELLERIKHFFNVSGCRFVIATDTKQLGHSIKAVYGSGFNSFGYLKRFFDITYSLDNSNIEAWIGVNFDIAQNNLLYCLEINREYKADGNGAVWVTNLQQVPPDMNTAVVDGVDLNDMQVIFMSLCKTFDVSLRDLGKIKNHIKASLLNVSNKPIHFFFLCYLIFLKNSDASSYHHFFNGDHRDFLANIGKKFPGWKLYFTTSSISVHQIALEYLEAAKSPRDDLMSKLNSSRENLSYQTKIYLDAANGEDFLRYSKLVDLAIQIK